MEVHTFLLHLLIILLSARLFAELAVRLQLPAVIGELFAGILLGPSLLGWVSPSDAIKLLAEIGIIILLLFEVGLDTDLQRLMRTGLKSFLVAIIGFVAPLLLGFTFAYWVFGLPLLVAMLMVAPSPRPVSASRYACSPTSNGNTAWRDRSSSALWSSMTCSV